MNPSENEGPASPAKDTMGGLLARIRELEQGNRMLRRQNKKLRARGRALRAGVEVPEDEVETEESAD